MITRGSCRNPLPKGPVFDRHGACKNGLIEASILPRYTGGDERTRENQLEYEDDDYQVITGSGSERVLVENVFEPHVSLDPMATAPDTDVMKRFPP